MLEKIFRAIACTDEPRITQDILSWTFGFGKTKVLGRSVRLDNYAAGRHPVFKIG